MPGDKPLTSKEKAKKAAAALAAMNRSSPAKRATRALSKAYK